MALSLHMEPQLPILLTKVLFDLIARACLTKDCIILSFIKSFDILIVNRFMMPLAITSLSIIGFTYSHTRISLLSGTLSTRSLLLLRRHNYSMDSLGSSISLWHPLSCFISFLLFATLVPGLLHC